MKFSINAMTFRMTFKKKKKENIKRVNYISFELNETFFFVKFHINNSFFEQTRVRAFEWNKRSCIKHIHFNGACSVYSIFLSTIINYSILCKISKLCSLCFKLCFSCGGLRTQASKEASKSVDELMFIVCCEIFANEWK